MSPSNLRNFILTSRKEKSLFSKDSIGSDFLIRVILQEGSSWDFDMAAPAYSALDTGHGGSVPEKALYRWKYINFWGQVVLTFEEV